MAFILADNIALAKILMSPKSPAGKYTYQNTEVSYDGLDDTLRKNLNELIGTPQLFRENKNHFYTLIENVMAEVLPKSVISTYGDFATIRQFGQGNTPYFTRKIGKTRAKQFITRVAEAGRYEVFELGEEKVDIKSTAYGGAARISFEAFLNKQVQFADYLPIINEGMGEAIYKEIASALIKSIESFPATNKVAAANFDESQFDRLLATVSAYGAPVIYCTVEAAMTLKPGDTNWISEAMKNDRWTKGYFTRYKGFPLIILPQSFTDDTNTTKVIDPAYIYIFPTNGEKPVFVGLEGVPQVKSFDNRDWSTEIQTYQKFGIGIQATNNLAVYKNTSISITNTPGSWS